MGLRIEAMRSNGSDGSAPLEGQSQIRATLLAEAVIRFGANAFSELCPTDGPAKVTEDTSGSTEDLDDLSGALEYDLNHYLTVTDKPWVPDTDQMLLRVGLDGCVFKKIYHDPILRRPISRAVFGDDLIVNNSSTSIYDAGRITHRVFMRPSMIRRMQLVGAYRDVELSDPGYVEKTPTELQSEQISGIRKFDSWEQDDRDHEVLECYCELDIDGFEHETDGQPDGLAVPYKVAITDGRGRCWGCEGMGTKKMRCVCLKRISSSFRSSVASVFMLLASVIYLAILRTASRLLGER